MAKQQFVTTRSKEDSVWQSVVENTVRRRLRIEKAAQQISARRTRAMPPLEPSATEGAEESETSDLLSLIDDCNSVLLDSPALPRANVLPPKTRAIPGEAQPSATRELSKTEIAKRCAALALRIAKAKVFGTAEEAQQLEGDFNYNVCDPFWGECIAEYVAYHKFAGATIPYRADFDNRLPGAIPSDATVAIVGDWGTGTAEATAVLRQIKNFAPDILMHLGDIYYSGTRDEIQERFVDVTNKVFGKAPPRTFSLAGNHDMYSGGIGYYWLVDQLGQGASYFSVENDDWLFVGMDTGLHDASPFQINSQATKLEDTEAAWVNKSVAEAGNRKVLLFSHHPLFSAYEPIGGGTINANLATQLAPSLPKVTAWFWGHEHRLGVYEPFQNLARGRCVGHGAVPVFIDAEGDVPKLPGVPVLQVNGKPIQVGSTKGIMRRGFAILQLAGPSATVSYYVQGQTAPIWSESF